MLLVARLAENKRHDLLVEAVSRVMPTVPNLHLVFVGTHGNASLRREIVQRIQTHRLGGRVTWLPFQDDIRMVECAADVLVLCSDAEPLGTCVLEAMSLEKPVIVSDSGGTCELVGNRVSGHVVPGGDARALAGALSQLAVDRKLGQQMGVDARRRVLERYTLQHHAEQVAAVLRAAAAFRR